MNSTASPSASPRLIEVKLGGIEQLFNSMDPSPFHERDLDHDAEQFILSWAQEFPSHSALRLVVHLERAPEAVADPQALIDAFQPQFDALMTVVAMLPPEMLGRTIDPLALEHVLFDTPRRSHEH